MNFINLSFDCPRDEALSVIKDTEFVNSNVSFDEKHGKPLIKISEKNDKIRITCEMTGRARKDNGFIVGTYFSGKLKENNGKTTLKGVILTAPIYHLILIILIGFFIGYCIKAGGFSVVPIFVVLFDIMLFYVEFKKQGIIKRYLERAKRRYDKKKNR